MEMFTALGISDKEIADHIGISTNTVALLKQRI